MELKRGFINIIQQRGSHTVWKLLYSFLTSLIKAFLKNINLIFWIL